MFRRGVSWRDLGRSQTADAAIAAVWRGGEIVNVLRRHGKRWSSREKGLLAHITKICYIDNDKYFIQVGLLF